ncbi:MAG: polyprenol monophosphomannose synthase [Methanosarcinaceae archaeon]|nr:polyprenol monophosphomannose synthase [Methanosarcinaceae archaeon]
MNVISIIIPTYNESENIENIINAIEEVFSIDMINGELVIVDDNSPDGTATIAERMKKRYDNIKVIVRTSDRGLSQSVVEGFDHCDSDTIGVIDCDFSHPPEQIPLFLEKIENGCDVVFGTRYASEGEIKGWGAKRKLISTGATFLARLLIPKSTDPVSGFFVIDRSVVKDVVLRPRGYKIGLEILGKGNWSKYCEIPYVFQDREMGSSKLGKREIYEYILQLFDIFMYKIR